MSWKERTIVKILLLVARILSDDHALSEELRHLATDVSVNAPKLERLAGDRTAAA